MKEIWKDIKGLENKYQISNFGGVRRLEYKDCLNRTLKAMPIKLQTVKGGYKVVGLKHVQYKVHRLIAQAFIPNPENKQFINHKDGNPSNNDINNLEWVTPKENTQHAFDIGLCKAYGEYNGRSKLKKEDVYHIRCIWQNRDILSKECGFLVNQLYISKMFNVSNSQISGIIKRKQWKHL